MIEINNLCKSFDGFEAVKDVSVKVEKGKIHGIIGENGAGKTTIIKCLAGIYKADKGRVLIDGESVYENVKTKEKIGYVADNGNYFPMARISDMVKFYSGVYPGFDRERFNEINQIFKLPLKRRINQLSKGMKTRLSFALNLSLRPLVLILDEPTSGLDPIAKKHVFDLIIEETEQRDCTVFISSHHLSELEKLCDAITVLYQGKITYQSSIDDIKSRIKKFQVIFKNHVDLSGIEEIINVEKIGSVYYIVVKEYRKELEDRLYDSGADIIEEIGMSLEEIFIYTNGGRED